MEQGEFTILGGPTDDTVVGMLEGYCGLETRFVIETGSGPCEHLFTVTKLRVSGDFYTIVGVIKDFENKIKREAVACYRPNDKRSWIKIF